MYYAEIQLKTNGSGIGIGIRTVENFCTVQELESESGSGSVNGNKPLVSKEQWCEHLLPHLHIYFVNVCGNTDKFYESW